MKTRFLMIVGVLVLLLAILTPTQHIETPEGRTWLWLTFTWTANDTITDEEWQEWRSKLAKDGIALELTCIGGNWYCTFTRIEEVAP